MDKTSGHKKQQQEASKSKYIKEPIKMVNGETKMKKYLKLKEVGSGSYSKCFLVRNVESQSTYVVKVIPKNKLEILNRQKLFYEIKIHQSLSHLNIVHLDHWYEDQKNQYIFLQYCSQGNLQMKIEEKKKLSQKQIKFYVRQIVEGIHYLHSQKILHRDLKLCNFYLNENQTIKLGDFGFACQLANVDDRKRQTCGTPNYIAPEAISGFGYSFSSDTWSIGVILFRLKYNECPFEGDTVKETLQNVKCCDYQFPKGVKISKELKDLIQKIFNINYDDRLSTLQILTHPFFAGTDKLVYDSKKKQIVQIQDKKLEKKEQKRSFSLSRILGFKEQEKPKTTKTQTRRKGIMQAQQRRNSKKPEPKRANSCQTFKEMKQIFKNKSKPNLQAQNMRSSDTNPTNYTSYSNYTSMENTVTGRDTQRSANRNIIEKFTENFYEIKTQENTRKSRISEFVKNQLETKNNRNQLKKAVHKKNANLIISSNENNLKQNENQILFRCCKKYYLPLKIQQQKDFIIVHYKGSLKQIIYSDNSYIIHRSPSKVYNMKGQSIQINKLPKICKYVIEHKLKIEEYDKDEKQLGQINIFRNILFIAHSWILSKQGIILRYGESQSFVVGKIFVQEGYYVKEDQKNTFMYNVVKDIIKIFDGIVVQRIYVGWLKSVLSNK